MPATAEETEPDRRANDAARPRTRVGVLLGSSSPEAWIVALLERIAAHPALSLHVAIVTEPARPSSAPPPSASARLARRLLRSALVDSPRFARGARQATPLPDALAADVVTLSDPPFAAALAEDDGRAGGRGEDEDGRLDVLLDVGRRDPDLERRLPPRTALWSVDVEHLETRVERALLARAPLVWLHVLERRTGTPDARWRVLASHALPRQSYSITDLVGAAFRALPGVLVARLGWLAAGRDPRAVEEASLPAAESGGDVGDEALFRGEREAVLRAAGRGAGRAPRPGAPAAALALAARRNLARARARLGAERWGLAVSGRLGGGEAAAEADVAPDTLARVGALDLDDWRAIEPPPDRLWADPHVIRHDDETHLFFEELVLGESRARIATARLASDGSLAEPARTALVEPFHLSYPFVFAHDGERWMLPETAGRRRVGLYRATRFPDRWERAQDLLVDVDLADSTLHRHDGRWWLFTNRFTDRSVDERDELLIYFADTLHGPWRAHALNPVVTGVDRARMAGPVIEIGATRYRPSQYGAVRYGHGINVARIDVLTPEDYRETPFRRLLPRPGSRWLGCHSLAIAGDLAVVDRVEHRVRGGLRRARR